MAPGENNPPLFLLAGPTGAGKTSLALEWAERHGAEIISSDALLFYRGLDIGTAKPTPRERARVPHHLIDVAPPDRALSVAAYAGQAREAVAAIEARGRRVLVVGGSGFYLETFFRQMVDRVGENAALRRELEARMESEGLASLVRELRELNPGGLEGLDTANPRRVLRALERCRAAGKTLAVLKAEFEALPDPFPGRERRLVVLDRDPAELAERIARRVRAMAGTGLLEEVRRLREQGLECNPTAARAIGYRETLDYLDGRIADEATWLEAIRKNTLGLVKKQRTWLKKHHPAAPRLVARGEALAELEQLFSASPA
ncbi:MAG: tRNA (adenosine(37)-N6)-dimethylallyltransferase MiaA [Puniceicoccaceae bacterium]|nr:MAG: tRNA (adenosine(37)-N6)-dimethylallyltransferase MiaA [Puniceicoccaceae bacterium]